MKRLQVAAGAVVVSLAVAWMWWRRAVAEDERLIRKLHERWISEETPISD